MKIIKLCFLLIIFASAGCSSDGNDDDESESKNNLTVELSDIKGTWSAVSSTDTDYNGIKLILDDKNQCTWTDKNNNGFVGPYYFLENVNDSVLKHQCSLIACDENTRIHIGDIKISKYATAESNNKDVYKSELKITCDLDPFLPEKDWQDFDKEVDEKAWYFWQGNDFSYTFLIKSYTSSRMELELTGSSIRFDSYTKDYPMRISKGDIFVFVKQ